MKPQIIIPVSLLMLAFILCSNIANATAKDHKKIKSEQSSFNIKNIKAEIDLSDNTSKNNRPVKPHKENEKDGVPLKEAAHKKTHSEEDGKHHHFHMHRAKKVKRCTVLVCFLAKILLFITHICLLIYAYYSTMAHVTH